MKSIQLLSLAALLTFGATSCNDKDFLDVPPRGALSDEQLNTPENADKQLIAAYSALANDGFTVPYTSLWPYGNLRSGDAYKGGGGIGDIEGFHFYETFTYNRTDVGNTDEVWFRLYVGIGRANDALRRLNSLTDAQMTNRQARIAEARFLRGHYYFILKELFDRVPYLDETVPVETYDQVSNVALTSQQLWDKIADDFQAGATALPANQPEVGRASQVAAKAYLAKVRLYQAYVQNETNHQVTSIDQAKLQEVLRLTNEVISSGKHSLYTDFSGFAC